MNDRVETYWKNFLINAKKDVGLRYYECFYFGLSESAADELLNLVLEGKKKATSSSYLSFKTDNSKIPSKGDYSIITDFTGNPKCIIETENVIILPFKEMTFDICIREGEDETLESWQDNHINFFTEEGKDVGYEFSWDMPVVFEDFKVVYT